MRLSDMSSLIFWALLAVVCLSPLPLASNRPLPWSALSLAVGLLLLLWGVSRLYEALLPGTAPAVADDSTRTPRGKRRPSHARLIDRHAALLATGFVILIAWYWVQSSPELGGAWAHVAWAQAAAALGEKLTGTISLDPAASRTMIMKIVAYGGVFLLALELGRDRRRAWLGFWAICLAGFAYAFYGLFIHFAGDRSILWFDKEAYPDSVTATFVNRNAYATYAGIAVLVGLVPLMTELQRFTRRRQTAQRFLLMLSEQASASLYIAIAAILTGLVAVTLTGSRAGVASLVLALAVFAVGLLVAREIRPRTFLIGALLAGAAVAGILMLSGDFLAKRLMTTDQGPEARAAVFSTAVAAVTAHPWVGQGLGSFGTAFNLANDGNAVFDNYVDLAHNTYVELAVEGGLPALALSLVLIGASVGLCLASMLFRARAAITSIVAVAIAAQVGAHSAVDFGIQMPAVAVTFMLLMGLAAAQALAVEVVEPQRFGKRRPARRGRDRPLSADEPVTPPHELEVPWPVRSTRPDLTAPARITGPTTLQSLSRMARGDVAATAPPVEEAGNAPTPADEYETAMARWRALRPSGHAGAPTPDAEASSTRPEPVPRVPGPAGGAVPQAGGEPSGAKIVKLPPRPSPP
ncbi:hypothetical protein FHP25_26140 [Vineibacter terrae]|uniref:O-antigen ligase-related domain-containing protein n=2 Tax=Vineibacter terrae TaxID=2586908 RepID=A0A5C8PGK6_9HYPH|nr:hypothetical protein FHP25_26140 [Vineibacter terrae]